LKFIMSMKRTTDDLRRRLSMGLPDAAGIAAVSRPAPAAAAPYRGAVRDTATVVDVSGSMGLSDFRPSRLDGAIQAGVAHATTCAKERPGDRIALVSFSERARVVLPLTPVTNRRTIQKAFRRLNLDGGTDLAQGLKAAAKLFENQPRTQRRRHVIMLTDGFGGEPLQIAAQLKKQLGVVIDVVGIGGSHEAVNEDLLREVATTDPDGCCHYRFIKDPEALSEHYTQLAQGLVWRGKTQ
jgi:Ca-activated chloride channel family protein